MRRGEAVVWLRCVVLCCGCAVVLNVSWLCCICFVLWLRNGVMWLSFGVMWLSCGAVVLWSGVVVLCSVVLYFNTC